jgi:hypothetical protein
MGERGQILIVSTLIILAMLLSTSLLLTGTIMLNLKLPESRFRSIVLEITYGGRSALATALADVSKTLSYRAETHLYQNYTSLKDYPEAEDGGYEILDRWLRDTLERYSPLGVVLNVSEPSFTCEWGSLDGSGYSRAEALISIDIASEGFKGFKQWMKIELNASLTRLIETDGEETSFELLLMREGENPVGSIEQPLISVYFEIYDRINDHRYVNGTTVESIRYIGDGRHIVLYSTKLGNITGNLEELWAEVYSIPDENFTGSKEELLNLIDGVKITYLNGNRLDAWSQLLYDVRPRLDQSSPLCIVTPETETEGILRLIDLILSQLRPWIRVVVRDDRGITVGAYGELLETEADLLGPYIRSAEAEPPLIIEGGEGVIRAEADDRWNGNSTISRVELFVTNTTTQPGTEVHGFGREMTPLDGALDESLEWVETSINSSLLVSGLNYVWIHALDSEGNWGDFEVLEVRLSEASTLQIASLELTGNYAYWWFWRYNWVTATVTITDTYGNPIEGAMVHGYWSGDVSGEAERLTDEYGRCTFNSPIIWGWAPHTYTFTVDNVYKESYTWDGETATETLVYPTERRGSGFSPG